MSPPCKPWLSVILPTHNGEKWVGAALKSLVPQLDKTAEVIVIDTSDGPGTRAIVETYRDRLNIRFVDPAESKGCMAKTNRGVYLARADYVSWLCQDDLWMPERAFTVRRWIQANPDAILHLAPSVIVDRSDKPLGVVHCPLEKQGSLDQRTELLCALLVQNSVSAVTPVVRREAWLALGGLDVDLWYTADWDLWLKLVRRGPVCLHQEATGGFRVHDEAATIQGARTRAEFVLQQQIVIDRHKEAIPVDIREAVLAQACASVRINADLAQAAGGRPLWMVSAAWEALRLGPTGLSQYVHRSRIIERTLPRLRARLVGAL